MKLLASDFDGTLFFHQEDPHFRPQDLKAIQTFQNRGHLFGICTGRPLVGITDFTKDIVDLDFYIVSSGALILDHDLHIIYEAPIDHELMENIIKIGDPLMIHADDGVYVNYPTPFPLPIQYFQTIDDFLNRRIYGFSIHFEDEETARTRLAQLNQIEGIIGFQNGTDLDFIKSGCSKVHGLSIVKDYYHLHQKDVSCIGDNYNDLPMLSSEYESFTFDTSPQEVRSQADHIITSLSEAIDYILES